MVFTVGMNIDINLCGRSLQGDIHVSIEGAATLFFFIINVIFDLRISQHLFIGISRN